MKHKNFFMVPNRIFDLELKPRDFSVYCCLLRHSDIKNGSCFPSRRVIAKECGIDRKTVDSAIENLSRLGLVKKIHRHRENGTIFDKIAHMAVDDLQLSNLNEKSDEISLGLDMDNESN